MSHQSGEGGSPPPRDLDQLDRLLRRIRFEPRPSLGAELLGRLRRGEQPALRTRFNLRRLWLAPVLAGLAAVLVIAFHAADEAITVDRCCYDLDGGGTADDGALIVGERDGRVFRLSVYEDRDGSGSLTPTDIVRYERRGAPTAEQLLEAAGGTRIQYCCHDLDGGGPPDDGILVLATPPDRVHTAAIYQIR